MIYHARIICMLSLAAIVVLLLQLAPAQAQTPKFVATFGSDDNNCIFPDTACRTLQEAHDKVFSGEKIVVLDSGDFGSVTITKSIAIVATGVHVAFDRSLPVVINAGPDAVVYLEGLAIGRDFIPQTAKGIEFISGGKLHVRNCVIRNQAVGIHVRGAGPKQVFVSDCTIADNKQGIWAQGGHNVFLDRVTVEGNLGNGVRSQGAAVVRISNSTITNNGRGLNTLNGGKIVSSGNNTIQGNGTNGAPTSTAPLR